MPVSYVTSGTFAGGVGAVTPGMPSGIAADDILLLFVETANQAASLSTPNGFASVGTPSGVGTAGDAGATLLSVFWKRAVGGDASPVVADSGDHQAARIGLWRGAKTSGNPWNVAPVWSTDAVSDTAHAATGVTTTINGCGIIVGASNTVDSNTGQTVSYSSTISGGICGTGMGDNSNAGGGGGFNVGFGVQNTLGATGTVTVTYGANTTKSIVVIALEPAPPVPVITVNRTALQYSQRTGGAATYSQDATVTVTEGATVTASDDAAWLTVSPGSGTTGQVFTITPDATGLSAGNHTATVTFTAPNGAISKTIAILFRVGAVWGAPEFDQTGDYQPANAFDANVNTRYASMATDSGGFTNPWVAKDFGSAQTFNQFDIYWENAFAPTYDIQSSTDGINWTTRASDTTAAAGTKTTTFTGVSARYWRVYATSMNNILTSMFEITPSNTTPSDPPLKKQRSVRSVAVHRGASW
jgi:hypothetical protein